MREIKFRVFNKKMLEVDTLFINEKMFRPVDGSEHDVWNYDTEYFSNPLQYTGLKDKNGVEIYEGDIVIADCRSGYNWNNGKYIIEYDKTNCCFYGNPRLVKQLFDLRLNVIHCEPISELRQKIEVIGNIYENPELLEGAK